MIAADDTLIAKRTVYYAPPRSSISADSAVIDTTTLLPSVDQKRTNGDYVEVSFYGTPGGKASFSIDGLVKDAPMIEETNDPAMYWGEAVFGSGDVLKSEVIPGHYYARHYIQATDSVVDKPVHVHLVHANGDTTSALSEGRISTFSNSIQIAETAMDLTVLRTGPRKSYYYFLPQKVRLLVVAGLIGIVLGYGLHYAGVTPIIKRICTSSFVIVSGGWCLLTLAFFYWFVDVAGFKRGIIFFFIFGMNPIFIYMFANTVGGQWFNNYVAIFSGGFFSWIGLAEPVVVLLNALAVLALEWLLCYWLYKREIFIKI